MQLTSGGLNGALRAPSSNRRLQLILVLSGRGSARVNTHHWPTVVPFAAAVLLSVMPVRGHACSIPCPSYRRPDEKAFQSAQAVFSATVVEKRGRDARLQVNEVYKGKVGPFIVVESGSRS